MQASTEEEIVMDELELNMDEMVLSPVEARIAELQTQIAELRKQKSAKQKFLVAQSQRRDEEEKKAVAVLRDRGLDGDGNKLSRKQAQQQPSGLLRALGGEANSGDEDADDEEEEDQGDEGDDEAPRSSWSTPVRLDPAIALPPITKEELLDVVENAMAVDSSDSEDEWDAVDDHQDDDEEEDEDEDEDEGDDDDDDDEESDGSESCGDGEWEDEFPYEDNLFRLSSHYHFIKRLATNEDAIVYQALQRTPGDGVGSACAIKILMGDEQTPFVPKAVNLVSAAQGHPNLVRLLAWHSLPAQHCYCLVLELVPNDSIEEFVFGQPEQIKIYVRDTILAIQHCHSQGVLFRDIKPDNIMWSHDLQKAVLIDFDVATFLRKQGHRAIVGSDGYMAPEIVKISTAKSAWKKAKIEERKREKTRKANEEAQRQKKIRSFHGRKGPKPLPQEEDEDEEEDEERVRPSLAELGCESYGVGVDVYSIGVVLGQLVFSETDEFVLDYPDNNKDTLHDHFMRLIAKEDTYKVEYDLVSKMTDKNPHSRISLDKALNHPYFSGDQAAAKLILDQHSKLKQVKVAAGGLRCFTCQEILSKKMFSKNQLKKKGNKAQSRRCMKCAAEAEKH